MNYIHIRNIEKYHPGYKDRKLVWAKIYFNMVQGDPDFEMIKDEIDKWRFICFIVLELQAKKTIPLDEEYLGVKKGMRFDRRPLQDTIDALSEFIEVEDERRDIKVRAEVDSRFKDEIDEIITYFNSKTNKNFRLTNLVFRRSINARLSDGFTVAQAKQVIDNKNEDPWFIQNPQHLNPETLFRPSNFEKYLNARPPETRREL